MVFDCARRTRPLSGRAFREQKRTVGSHPSLSLTPVLPPPYNVLLLGPTPWLSDSFLLVSLRRISLNAD